MFLNEFFSLNSFPVLVKKAIHEQNANAVDHKEKQPDQNTPDIPVDLLVKLNDFIENDKKNRADEEEYKMEVKPFLLFGPFTGLLV